MSLLASGLLPLAATAPARTARHKLRVLLALDGTRLTPALLMGALAQCARLTDRMDILLVNSPKAPTSLLCGLLLKLEHAGIDYRLDSSEGDLGQQILRYLHRFKGISLILVDSLAPLEQTLGDELARLRQRGCRFLPIATQTT
jgi:hypothetical protein